LILLLHSSPSKAFKNLEDPLEFVNVLVCPPDTFFSESKEFRCALLALDTEFPILFVHSLQSLKNPEQFNNSIIDSEFYPYPAYGTYHTSIAYAYINTK
jgi:hypothetical protein